eukprot:scaffold7455_cov72-Phaeocystis_antarctica.AAC.3
MLGCTVTRRAVDLGCSLDRHDLSAPRDCEFDAERRPEIRIRQCVVDERAKYLCPLCKSRVHRCTTQSCIQRLWHLDSHLQLEPPPARAQCGRAVQLSPLGSEPAPIVDGCHLRVDQTRGDSELPSKPLDEILLVELLGASVQLQVELDHLHSLDLSGLPRHHRDRLTARHLICIVCSSARAHEPTLRALLWKP